MRWRAIFSSWADERPLSAVVFPIGKFSGAAWHASAAVAGSLILVPSFPVDAAVSDLVGEAAEASSCVSGKAGEGAPPWAAAPLERFSFIVVIPVMMVALLRRDCVSRSLVKARGCTSERIQIGDGTYPQHFRKRGY
jgi:hypothetical protein